MLKIENIGVLYTMERRGTDLLGEVRDAVVHCEQGHIAYAGPALEAPQTPPDVQVVNAGGNAVLPGLIDSHTHLLWAGNRRDEFAMRARGASYTEVMAAGGGIRSTVRAVRETSTDELARQALPRLEEMLWRGVTTVEAKSGYGLSIEDECKMLEALRRLHAIHDIDIVPTFLGAHAVPAEYHGRSSDYVSLVVEEMLPRVVDESLAEYCDVFVEAGAFSVDEARQILQGARALGLGIRVHAEQLSRSGGAKLAAELGATAAGHLEFATDDDIQALAKHGVVCEVLATAQVFLGMEQRIPGRALAGAGCRIAVATDMNPGSAHCADLHLAAGLAVTMSGLTVEEALLGITAVAADSLDRPDRGRITSGRRADLIILDTPSAVDLVYAWGRNPVSKVIKSGRLLDIGDDLPERVTRPGA